MPDDAEQDANETAFRTLQETLRLLDEDEQPGAWSRAGQDAAEDEDEQQAIEQSLPTRSEAPSREVSGLRVAGALLMFIVAPFMAWAIALGADAFGSGPRGIVEFVVAEGFFAGGPVVAGILLLRGR